MLFRVMILLEVIFRVLRLVDVDLNPVWFWITVQEERDAGGKGRWSKAGLPPASLSS